jgi:hypothetical protein
VVAGFAAGSSIGLAAVTAWERARRSMPRLRRPSVHIMVFGQHGHLCPFGRVVPAQPGNDAIQAAQDLTDHLGQAGLAGSFGCGDQLQGYSALIAVWGQEFLGHRKHRVGHAGVCLEAAGLDWLSVESVDKSLGRSARASSGPGRFGQGPSPGRRPSRNHQEGHGRTRNTPPDQINN